MKTSIIIRVAILFGIFGNCLTATNGLTSKNRRQEIIESKLTFGSDNSPNLLSSSANIGFTPKVDLSEAFDIPKLFQSVSNGSDTIFNKWKSKYGFKYQSDKVESQVKNRFQEKLNDILEHNNAYEEGFQSYAITVDGYSGLEENEFITLRTGLNPKKTKKIKKALKGRRPKLTKKVKALTAAKIPKSTSIINSPNYPPVQDQLTCGSCWAFSSVAVFNYQINVKNGDCSSDLSVQQILDCDTTNFGCNGGLPDNLFKSLVKSEYGVVSAKKYPYKNSKSVCLEPFKNESFKIVEEEGKTTGAPNGWGLGTEDELAEMVYRYGAVVIAVAVQDNFSSYSKGIFNGCKKPVRLNHAVVAVGYGVTATGKKFWIVRNSWGPKWGVGGHIYILRGVEMCGIGMYFTAPTVMLIESD